MLIDEHPYGDSRHVEAIKEILNTVLSLCVHNVRFLQLNNTLGHRLHNICVPIADHCQGLTESAVE